jgi:hypothetical protein
VIAQRKRLFLRANVAILQQMAQAFVMATTTDAETAEDPPRALWAVLADTPHLAVEAARAGVPPNNSVAIWHGPCLSFGGQSPTRQGELAFLWRRAPTPPLGGWGLQPEGFAHGPECASGPLQPSREEPRRPSAASPNSWERHDNNRNATAESFCHVILMAWLPPNFHGQHVRPG